MDGRHKHSGNITVEKFYTDINGNLFPIFLADILSEISAEHSSLSGCGIETLLKMNQTWMLHRLHVRIKQFPRKNESIVYNTWCSAYSGIFALRDYQLLEHSGSVIVDGTSEWMMIDLEKRRPIRLSPKIIEDCGNHSVKHLEIPSILNAKGIPDNLSEYRAFNATYSNIDFNGHVTQASYIRWITDALPFEFLKRHCLKEFEILYEHEILPDSEILSTYEILDKDTSVNDSSILILHKLISYHGDMVHCTAKTLWKRLEE